MTGENAFPEGIEFSYLHSRGSTMRYYEYAVIFKAPGVGPQLVESNKSLSLIQSLCDDINKSHSNRGVAEVMMRPVHAQYGPWHTAEDWQIMVDNENMQKLKGVPEPPPLTEDQIKALRADAPNTI